MSLDYVSTGIQTKKAKVKFGNWSCKIRVNILSNYKSFEVEIVFQVVFLFNISPTKNDMTMLWKFVG